MFMVLFAYDAIHDQLGAIVPPPHTWPQIHADQALFGVPIPTLALQQSFYTPGRLHWWDLAALLVYTSHFVALTVIALVLWFRSRPRYIRFMAWFVGLTTLGFITYALYPAVPPWLASQHRDLAPTHRIVREIWEALGCRGIAAMFSGANIHVNDIAAIPSLHAAYPLIIALFFWRTSRAGLRIVLATYPIAMALTLVYTAEHYMIDILLGWGYVLVTALVMQAMPWGREGTREPTTLAA